MHNIFQRSGYAIYCPSCLINSMIQKHSFESYTGFTESVKQSLLVYLTTVSYIFPAHYIWISVVYTHVRYIYRTYLYQLMGKIKINSHMSASCWPHVDPCHHCNVKMASPCQISAYSGFSGSLFHVFPILSAVISGEQEKESIILVRMDRKICPSQSPFVITQPAL